MTACCCSVPDGGDGGFRRDNHGVPTSSPRLSPPFNRRLAICALETLPRLISVLDAFVTGLSLPLAHWVDEISKARVDRFPIPRRQRLLGYLEEAVFLPRHVPALPLYEGQGGAQESILIGLRIQDELHHSPDEALQLTAPLLMVARQSLNGFQSFRV